MGANGDQDGVKSFGKEVIQVIYPVVQTQVNAHIELTAEVLLKALLRQDPDVIMVGDMEDVASTRLAAEAALDGHLVLGAYRGGNAIHAVLRLVEDGLPSYLVASSLRAVLTQRLAARICENCKKAYTPDASVLARYFYDAEAATAPVFYRGEGCQHCRQTGYHNRVAFHEFVLVSERMRSLIAARADEEALVEAATEAGYRPLRYDGMKKVLLGLTTLEELEATADFDWAQALSEGV